MLVFLIGDDTKSSVTFSHIFSIFTQRIDRSMHGPIGGLQELSMTDDGPHMLVYDTSTESSVVLRCTGGGGTD